MSAFSTSNVEVVAQPDAQEQPAASQDIYQGFVIKMKYEEESKPIKFLCRANDSKITLKLLEVKDTKHNTTFMNIPKETEAGFGLPIEYLARLFYEEAIPAMMKKEGEAIQKYLKS